MTVDADNRLPGVARRSLYGEFGWNRRAKSGFSALADVRYVDDVQVDDVNSDAAASYTVTGLRLIYPRSRRAGATGVRSCAAKTLFDREYAGSGHRQREQRAVL